MLVSFYDWIELPDFVKPTKVFSPLGHTFAVIFKLLIKCWIEVLLLCYYCPSPDNPTEKIIARVTCSITCDFDILF